MSRPPYVIRAAHVITRTASIIRPIANLDRDGAWGGDIARGTGITGSVWAINRVTGSVCRRTSDRLRGRAGGRNLSRGCRRCHSGWFLGAANEEKWRERQYINTYSHISLSPRIRFAPGDWPCSNFALRAFPFQCEIKSPGIASLCSAQSDAPYTEGPVWNITMVKAKYGMGDEYLKGLAKTFKGSLEEAKKQDLILDYKILLGTAEMALTNSRKVKYEYINNKT
jgi:hypothetical protein